MTPIDNAIHLLGTGLLVILGLLWWWIKNPRLKQIILNLMTLVVGVIVGDMLLHVLPNSIARFIYGSHAHYSR
ncbi:MAG: hypothetical protein HOP02_09035 [Methylococcaceae bacterium]|nr:hypothetical protein [Methylococcaceae bacterium]